LALLTAAVSAQAIPIPAASYGVDLSYIPAGQGGAGQIASIGYPSGKTLTYQYDATGQLTALTWNGQSLIANIAWTPLGQPKSWRWAFVQGQPGASRSYNTAGQLTSNGIASYQYDAAGRVSGITQSLFGPAASAGGPAQPFAITTAIGYDAVGRVISVTHAPQGNINLPAGIVVQDIIGPLQTSYGYDANGNRSQASYGQIGGSGDAQSLDRVFSLDGANNRIQAVQDTLTQTGGAIEQDNRNLQWDASGRLISDGKLSFEYDPRGRISKITTASGTATSYQSNALGQRIRKIETNNQVTDTVYGEQELGMDSYPLGNYRPGDSSQTTEYIYLPTASGPMPIAVQIGNDLYAIDSDHLNTPRRLMDANGNPVWQWVTTGFGEFEPTTAQTGFVGARLETGTPAIANTQAVEFNLRYPGQQYDKETGLYYNHHRTYDPYLTVGYTQADPIGLDGGWNRFAYAERNPLGYSDPQGRSPAIVAACIAAPEVCLAAGISVTAIAAWENRQALADGARALGGLIHQGCDALSNWMSSEEAPNSPTINPSDVAGKTPDEIDQLARGAGLQPKGPNPQNGQGAYVDPVTGEQRILVHGDHAHVNDPAGNRLDINGQQVPSNSPDAHLPVKP
jgi:RHS repeat-associated protein